MRPRDEQLPQRERGSRTVTAADVRAQARRPGPASARRAARAASRRYQRLDGGIDGRRRPGRSRRSARRVAAHARARAAAAAAPPGPAAVQVARARSPSASGGGAGAGGRAAPPPSPRRRAGRPRLRAAGVRGGTVSRTPEGATRSVMRRAPRWRTRVWGIGLVAVLHRRPSLVCEHRPDARPAGETSPCSPSRSAAPSARGRGSGLAELLPTEPGRWPWGTFVANIAGCVLLGYAGTRLMERLPPSTYRRPFVGTGVCGGLTTFSAFQLEVVELGRDGHVALAAAYLVGLDRARHGRAGPHVRPRAPRPPGARVSGIWVWLAAGALGAVGAVARFVLDGAIGRRVRGDMPWGTLTVNLIGALAIGVCVGAGVGRRRALPGGRGADRLVHHVLHLDVRDPAAGRGGRGAAGHPQHRGQRGARHPGAWRWAGGSAPCCERRGAQAGGRTSARPAASGAAWRATR